MKKISSVLMVLLFMLFSFTMSASTLHGDVNNDGKVNIEDVTDLINYLLTFDDTGISVVSADTDLDGKVNINDITTMIDYLLTGVWENDPITPPDDHEWVDLGLPSGTLWATCNVGANSPEEYGDYFAWGETEPKDYYDWNTYKWCNGTYQVMTKYCTDSYYGMVDNKNELDPEDDAAYVNWGSSWRTPTQTQQDELRENCSWKWTQVNGVNGQLVTGPNGNTMFLPAAGHRNDNALEEAASWGRYWSRTLRSSGQRSAFNIGFNMEVDWWANGRYNGFSVRAVRVSQN